MPVHSFGGQFRVIYPYLPKISGFARGSADGSANRCAKAAVGVRLQAEPSAARFFLITDIAGVEATRESSVGRAFNDGTAIGE